MATAIERVRSTVKWTNGTNLAAGIWLILAPFILGYSSVSAALWNDILIGLAVAALAWARVAKPLELEGASWTNAVLGVCLLVAPLTLGYSATCRRDVERHRHRSDRSRVGAWSAIASRGHQPTGQEPAMTS